MNCATVGLTLGQGMGWSFVPPVQSLDTGCPLQVGEVEVGDWGSGGLLEGSSEPLADILHSVRDGPPA